MKKLTLMMLVVFGSTNAFAFAEDIDVQKGRSIVYCFENRSYLEVEQSINVVLLSEYAWVKINTDTLHMRQPFSVSAPSISKDPKTDKVTLCVTLTKE